MTFKEQIETYLEPLPSEWKEKLTTLLCEIHADRTAPTCEEVKDCETLTTLSNFSVSGTSVSIQYKDEKGVTFTRSFNVADLLNNQLNDVDPNCLTDESSWQNLTFPQRIRLLIDAHCECCD